MILGGLKIKIGLIHN